MSLLNVVTVVLYFQRSYVHATEFGHIATTNEVGSLINYKNFYQTKHYTPSYIHLVNICYGEGIGKLYFTAFMYTISLHFGFESEWPCSGTWPGNLNRVFKKSRDGFVIFLSITDGPTKL